MARPRKFDEERAVEAAMHAFWAAGYEATSTEDLCRATGLGRSSIYNTFKSKRDLFDRALRHYTTVKTARVLAALEGDAPVRDKVRALFEQILQGDADEVGCLVVNTSVELAPRDPGIAALLRRDYDVRFTALRTVLDTARRTGEIAADKDPGQLAHFVITTISGMQVSASAGADRATLRQVAGAALGAL
ncbi:TetR/AcrR family transcriptional regulator [Actinomadura hibisca]|uniref:TetR/AcrR family transcriptional regulator n=1 Tax=Actinomadura hibisca TaxID=68565 RepID=UPI000833ED9F|nr:TetR/AcrR family transcriptional regulator [Actinomadura hibisca]